MLFSLWAAYCLRSGAVFSDFGTTWHIFLLLTPITIVVIASLGVYRWMIRSSNTTLFFQLSKAAVFSAIVLALLTFLLPPDRVNPRSIVIIFGLVMTTSLISVRILWQSLFDSGTVGEPVAIYGAGQMGASLVQSLSQGVEYLSLIHI